MNIQQLEYIVAVYQYGNFAKAAEKCFVTQPTLSMMIKKMEEELGTIIFDRNKNPIVPTETGKKIIEYAQKILHDIGDLKNITQLSKINNQGKLKLGIIPTIAPYLLPLILHSFAKKYPDIVLEIYEITTDEITEQIEKGLLDIGILSTPLNNHHLLEKKMFVEKFFVYTSDKTLLKKKKLKISDLKHLNIWLLKDGHCMRNQVLEICKPQNFSSIQFVAGNIDTIVKLIDFYGGTTIVPELMLKYMNKTQLKKVVSFENPAPAREISVVQNKLFIKEHLINVFYDHTIAVIKEELSPARHIKIIYP